MTRTVAHLVDTEEFGGAERALLHLVSNHDRRHWRPVLLHPAAPGLAPLTEGARAAGVELRVVPPMRRFRGAARLPTLLRAVGAVRPDVFHAHLNWPLACSAALLGAALRVPIRVATVQLFGPLPSARTIGLQRRIVVPTVDRYLAVSSGIARQLRDELRVPSARIRVVPNAIAPAAEVDGAVVAATRAALDLPAGRPLVVTLARLTEQKGLDDLLQAATRVPDAGFVIAGDGPLRASLEERIARLGLRARVRLIGFRTDTAALLAAADLFVLPSLYEGLPLSILEAMAAGKAVVASAIPGVDEAVVHGETGVLVPPRSPDALATAIRALLADPDRRRGLGAAGAQRVRRRFSACTMASSVEAVYDELLAERSPEAAGPGAGSAA